MTLRATPYLMMDGNAKEAIQFYEKTLDAKVLQIQTYGDMPDNPSFGSLPAEVIERVAYAMIKVGESDIMFSDTFPGSPYQTGNQVTICITTNDVEKSKQIYEALQQGGRANHPLEETSFSPAFGSLTDKYGVTFSIVTEIEN